jgi:hypothetical protein
MKYVEAVVAVVVKPSLYWRGQAPRVQEVVAPRFQDDWHMKLVTLSVLPTGHLYSPGNNPDTPFH